MLRLLLLTYCASLALIIGPIHAPAQTANTATGSINGRIQNLVTGQFLNRVRVSVKGTQ